MSTPRPALVRSAGVGLTVGLLLGSIFLAVRAMLLGRASCEGMGAEECALTEELSSHLIRLHSVAAGGLALVALGLYLSLRHNPGAR